ncbi:MAG: Gfo/Idh/MocA family oxidoreductase [Armatimonadota bacterium]|nr:Gfo/Idh/MocA family oxidoreductase [bacterium]
MRKVALIGAGGMGRVHAGAYAQLPEAELVAVCDMQVEVARKLADAHGAKAYDNFQQMISEIDVDVVDICVPTFGHLEYIKAAADAGKPVICEKPLARTVGQAQEALRICEEAGVTLFVAHVLRWFPEYRKIRNLIADGAVGDVVDVRTSRGGGHPQTQDSWYADYKRSGGVVLDLIIHDFDWLRWCFGKVHRVYAAGLAEAKIPLTDYALVTIKFDSGVIAHVEGSWAKPGAFKTSVEVAGTKGLLSGSNFGSVPLMIERKAVDGPTACMTVPQSPLSQSPYMLELRHFIHCIECGETPEVTAEDGIEAVKIAEAALRSISSGQPVVLA